MNRRTYIKAIGVVGAIGAVGAEATPETPIAVKVWFGQAAAELDGLRESVTTYVRSSLESAGREVTVDHMRTPIAVEPDHRRTFRVLWPKLVWMGYLNIGPLEPARDINLLVTDNDVRDSIAGYGMRRVAAVGGARHLAAMESPERTPRVVDFSAPGLATQLMVHEVGHALGLTHRHGSVSVAGDAAITSPMTTIYPWKGRAVRRHRLHADRNRCGEAYPDDVTDKRPRLQLQFSSCSRRHIAGYRGAMPA